MSTVSRRAKSPAFIFIGAEFIKKWIRFVVFQVSKSIESSKCDILYQPHPKGWATRADSLY